MVDAFQTGIKGFRLVMDGPQLFDAIGSEDTVIDPVTTAKDCVAAIAREAMDERIKELAAAMQTGGSDEEKREYMELVKKRVSLK